jgi:zinc protease
MNPLRHLPWRQFVCAALLACAPGLLAREAQAAPLSVSTHTLANGMTLLVQEDPSIPNIAFYTFYKVGSRNEHEGITGLSHFFEHMMFNGAQKYGKGEFDSSLDNAGGSNNAYTNRDTTVYQDWTPDSALELVFDLEADRIQNLAFLPDVVNSERQVVYSERRLSVDNSNDGRLNEALNAVAFESSPYHWPIVGWPSDIESWTIDDLKTYHAMAYSPTNATVVVVGDVKAADVFRLADQYFAPIPAHTPPPPIRTKEMPQTGERRVVVYKFAQLPLLMIGYHAVAAKDPDLYPLMVAKTILSTGQSSRLYRALVDTQLALQVSSNLRPSMDPSLFTFEAQPRGGVKPEAVEAVIYAELDKLKSTPASEQELTKAKNQITAQHFRELETIAGRAQEIGAAQVFFGDWQHVNQEEQLVNAVTAADVQRVMQKYFASTNRTVATLIPDTTPEPAPSTAPKEKQ